MVSAHAAETLPPTAPPGATLMPQNKMTEVIVCLCASTFVSMLVQSGAKGPYVGPVGLYQNDTAGEGQTGAAVLSGTESSVLTCGLCAVLLAVTFILKAVEHGAP